ncbi:MAG TPA: Stp1/IreP family PP2C-type Ser/Thr phosphatase [Solirubrobacteraceae bacterium]|nr:Stp1/IreP family PP2C-type Ser/Thr phosphatase [Solirubrobacteraceae bacterium]
MLRVAEHCERTDTGRQRRANEDAFFARAPLFAVADGMGGAQAGEVASGAAIEVLSAGLAEASGPARPDEERLAGLVAAANARVHELSVGDAGLAGMGTTVTVAYVGEDAVAIAHVGDSRAYLLRDGAMERLTNDHSLVEEFVRQGKLTPEQADEHPQRSIITRALGPEPEVEVDRMSVGARDGDVFLICSDGLTSMVGEAQVAETIAAAATLAGAARDLVDAANAAGGRDNITVVLFRLEEVGAAPAADEQHTAIVAGPTAAEVRAALAVAERAGPAPSREMAGPIVAAPSPAPAPSRRLSPRMPRRDRPARRRRRRWLGPLVVALVLRVPICGGAYLANQAVFFLGLTSDGSVAVFKGLPYELPAGIRLYSTEYVTGLTAAQLPASRRRELLDHQLRSSDDARDLARALELGQVGGR